MTITEADIKLMASERMNDDSDGGGYMTGTVVQSGVENNAFPDISDLDRAQGAMDFRKMFCAVLTNTTDTYYGAHSIIDQIADDPAIFGILIEAASVSETKAQLISRMNFTLMGVGPYYGTLPLQEEAAFGDQTIALPGITTQLIPKIKTLTPGDEKPLQGTGSAGDNQLVLIEVGSTLTYTWNGTSFGGDNPNALPVMPGSISGTCTFGGAACHFVEDLTLNRINIVRDSDSVVVSFWEQVYSYYQFITVPGGSAAFSFSYKRALPVWLPREYIEVPITSANQATVYTHSIPSGTVPGSEEFTHYITGQALPHILRNVGSNKFANTAVDKGQPTNLFFTGPSGTVDRSAGQIIVSLDATVPKAGTSIRFYFVRGGYAQNLPFSAVSNSGTITSNQLTLTTTSGFHVADCEFTISGVKFKSQENGNILKTDTSTVVGFLDRTAGTVTMIGYNGQTVSGWLAVEASAGVPITSISAPVGSNLEPLGLQIDGETQDGDPFTATANAYGAFSTSIVSGVYSQVDGTISLTFSEPVKSGLLTYTASTVGYTMPDIDADTLVPDNFPDSGKVPIFALGDVVVVHNTQSMAPATVTGSSDIDTGRTLLAKVWVYGNDGDEITTGFSVNKLTGHVIFSDVSGYSQPVTIVHRVEDMAVIVSITEAGSVVLSRPLSHDYPDPSYISSALIFGDLQARSHGGFQQSTWTGVWSDSQIGSSITADYNEAVNPIQVTNDGAIDERWAIIFLTSTTFKVVGEQVGEIMQGSISTPTAPLNPATLEPYFTIPSAGWGSGWSAGNVYRFNTDGANAPLWLIRSIVPSDPTDTQDKFTLAIRGNINA